ncbi:uncharacterized protein NPIL_377661, partial [Nephila pilipes]
FLISKGANTHAEDNTTAGKKPIHVAAIEGHIDIIKFFLNQGVSIEESDKEGRTSLYYAASNGHLETVKFLADKGANIHAKNIRGTKPIHVAALDGHKNIIEFLLDRGANVNDSDKDNWTPLHYAAQEGQLGVVRFLISKRANVHAKNTYGAKPIHIAAMGGSQEIIEFLLSNGASVDDTNKNGETPLHYAASEGRLEIVKFLIDKGANINAENIYGSKAINLARRKGHSSVEKLLSLHESCPIQSTNFNKEQQEKFLRSISDADVRRVKQGLYLPSFEARNVEIDGKCVAITRGLSQALFLHSNKSFLSNLATSAKIYECIAQGKQISKRKEREVFAFSKLLDGFEQQLDFATNSLPSNLIHTQGYKTLDDLSNYIAEIKGNFAIHLVTSNHVVAIYRTGDNYAYFDSNVAFVSGLKSVDQLMEVVEKGVESAGYKVEEKGFLVEHFDVARANNQLPDEDKQILTREIKTERQLLAEQDKELGFIKINGQEVSRVQLYDFGTKINVEGSVPLLINADMNLSSEKFQDHLDKKEVSMTAREYLDSLKNSKNVKEVVQATKGIPFIGANINAENIYGSKAINLARRKGHSSVEKLLSLHESCPIQSTNFNKEQQEKFLRSISDADVRRVKQGLYLPSFEARNVEIDGKCVAITRGLSQALFLHSNKSFLSNLATSAKIYECIAQGKQISKRKEREVFAFSKLLDGFEQQLDFATNSLPSNLIHTQGYKTLDDLSNYIAEIK